MKASALRVWACGIFLALLLTLPSSGLAPMCSVEAKGAKKCACPISDEEKVVIPCSSVVDIDSCGACSVVSPKGHRDGRSCVSIP